MKGRKRNSAVLQVLEAPQLCSAGNTHLFVAVKDEAAQSTGEGEKDKHEKSGRESKRKKTSWRT